MDRKHILILSLVLVFILSSIGCGSNKIVDTLPQYNGNSLDIKVQWPVNNINRKAPPAYLGITTIEVILAPVSIYNQISSVSEYEHQDLIIADLLSQRTEVIYKSYDVTPGSPYENGVNIEEVIEGDYFFFFIPVNAENSVPFYYTEALRITDNTTTYVNISYNSWEITIPVNKTPEVFEKSNNSIGIAWEAGTSSGTYEIEVNNSLVQTYYHEYTGDTDSVIVIITDLDNGTEYNISVYENAQEGRTLLGELSAKTNYFADPGLRNTVIATLNTINGISVLSEDYLTDDILSNSEFISLSSVGTAALSSPSKNYPNRVNGTPINNLQGLEFCQSLQNVDFSGNSITDITYLASLTNLRNINLSGNSITDIASFSFLSSLEMLDISGNNISNISPLSSLFNLNSLNLSGNAIADIAPLASITSLQNLNISNTVITDISVLSSLINLVSVDIENNPNITDYTVLDNLPGVIVNTGGVILPVLSDIRINAYKFDIPVAFTVLYKKCTVEVEFSLNGGAYQQAMIYDNTISLSPGTYTVMWDSYYHIINDTAEVSFRISTDQNSSSILGSDSITVDNRTAQLANFVQHNYSGIIEFSFDVLYDTASVTVSVSEDVSSNEITDGITDFAPGTYTFSYDSRVVFPFESNYLTSVYVNGYNRFEETLELKDNGYTPELNIMNMSYNTLNSITNYNCGTAISMSPYADSSENIVFFYIDYEGNLCAYHESGFNRVSENSSVTEILDIVSGPDKAVLLCMDDSMNVSLISYDYTSFSEPLQITSLPVPYMQNEPFFLMPNIEYYNDMYHIVYIDSEVPLLNLKHCTFDGNVLGNYSTVFSQEIEPVSGGAPRRGPVSIVPDLTQSAFAVFEKSDSESECVYLFAGDQGNPGSEYIWNILYNSTADTWEVPVKVTDKAYDIGFYANMSMVDPHIFKDEYGNSFIAFADAADQSVNVLDLVQNTISSEFKYNASSLDDYSVIKADGEFYGVVTDNGVKKILKTDAATAIDDIFGTDPNYDFAHISNIIRDSQNRNIIFATMDPYGFIVINKLNY